MNGALEVRRLSRAYPGTLALDDVTLGFPGGKVSAIIGRNGAGKSTLVKILSGAVRPSRGEVLVCGERVVFRSPQNALMRGVATVHQELSLVPELSAGENILVGRLPRRRGVLAGAIDWSAAFTRAETILRSLGAGTDPRARVSTLSLAGRQVVEIARAVSFDPRAVLLDEPTAGLARREVENLFEVIRALARRGVAVVYVTHRLAELREIADTVTVLRDGRHVTTIPASEAAPTTLVETLFGGAARGKTGGLPEPTVRESSTGSTDAGSLARDNLVHRSAPSLESVQAATDGSTSRGEPVMVVRALRMKGVLHGVNLTLHRGEVLGIAGMLGSGRSELLMSLFGALRADGGEVHIEDLSSEVPSHRGAAGHAAGGDTVYGARADRSSSRRLVGTSSPPQPGTSSASWPPPPPDPSRRPDDPFGEPTGRGPGRWAMLAAGSLTPARMKRLGVALVPEDRTHQGLVLSLSTLDNGWLASLEQLPGGSERNPIWRRGLVWKRLQRRALEGMIRDLRIRVADPGAVVSSLSGGNQQKVVVGRWLATGPRIMLFDEPTRGIDVEAKHQIFGILRGLSRRGVASIFVSSELEELLEICDRILVMRAGQIVDEVNPDGLSADRLVTLCMYS